MALVSVEELLESREAKDARLESTDAAHIQTALDEAEALLLIVLGFSPEESFEDGDAKLTLAKQFVRVAATRQLHRTAGLDIGMPNLGGSLLTSYSTDGAQFTFYTPTGGSTGYEDLDRIAGLIAGRDRSGIQSIELTSSYAEVDPTLL